jgi:hypothetical protein
MPTVNDRHKKRGAFRACSMQNMCDRRIARINGQPTQKDFALTKFWDRRQF